MAKPRMCDPGLFEQGLSKHVHLVAGANRGIGLVTIGQLAKQGGWPMVSPNPAALDDAVADRLWDVSRQATGLA